MKLNKIKLHKKTGHWPMSNPDTNKDIADEMVRVMRANKGIGLAANQVGMGNSLFVMEVDGVVRHCFNPHIFKEGVRQETMKEGCLSYPGQYVELSRTENITVDYQDHAGNAVTEELTGLASRVYQHELDHLRGITMLDRQVQKLKASEVVDKILSERQD